jgi:hypothetical protein
LRSASGREFGGVRAEVTVPRRRRAARDFGAGSRDPPC